MPQDKRLVPDEELNRQRGFIEKIKDRAKKTGEQGRPLRAFTDTYGCQQNEADTERLRGMILEMGYTLTKSEDEADLIVINTCAVREHAEMRVLGNVGALSHIKKRNPDLIIAVCGCMVQQESVQEKLKKSYPYVDLVFGTHAVWRFPELLYKKLSGGGRVFDAVNAEERGMIAEGLPIHRDERGRKAWLSIMYGCNNFCSYCIVPYVRGRERSRAFSRIMDEFRGLVNEGYKDITLLGQNVNSYGKDTGEGIDFADLLYRLNEVEGDFLIRFMTSHPKDASPKLFSAIADCCKVAKQLHLPFQSGSSRVLKSMNRGYDKESYIALAELAKKTVPGIVLTSDVIVGFPGETEEDFCETLDLIEKVRYHALFTFLYSKRPGTKAAEMEDVVSKEEKQRRFDRLLKIQNEISKELHEEYVGKTMRVLIDDRGADSVHTLSARTDGGRLVHLNGSEALIGSYADVKIIKSSNWALFGELA
ncbi:MAG: tRNA (N6-isopentenyl adenosine(37)-C2)-methylthiotransferase MiaB [Bacillota bacterium]|nr:tRNA (N6-isopentenyl adenosine(37)-C2)-methylthiotransferase MiaB [Bacillota bacterium]